MGIVGAGPPDLSLPSFSTMPPTGCVAAALVRPGSPGG